MRKTIPWRRNMAVLNSPEGTLVEFFNSHFFESSQFTLPTFHCNQWRFCHVRHNPENRFSGIFANAIRYTKRVEILLYSASFCPLKSKINSYFSFNFLSFCRAGKKKVFNFLLAYHIHTLSWVLFVDIFLIVWPLIYSTLNKRCLEPDLVSVVTRHIVYFCDFARVEVSYTLAFAKWNFCRLSSAVCTVDIFVAVNSSRHFSIFVWFF